MISLIICSRKTEDFEKVRQNIAETIGVVHEVIQIDNSRSTYSISQAYNEGARKSQYPLLCFVHEDVAFVSQHWGHTLLRLLDIPTIGLVGVAGGILKTKATGPTWWSPLKGSARLHLIQKTEKGEKNILHENPLDEAMSEVVALDGVFMACRKEVWQKMPFDEQTVQAFHFYDLDFSLRIGGEYKVVVTYDILLEHFSEGRNDLVWAEQADIVTEKWRRVLPIHTVSVSPKELQEAEKQTADFYLHLLFKLGGSKKLQRKYIWRRFLAFPLDKLNLYYLRKYLGKE